MSVSKIIPQLLTTDLEDSITFYISKLGFELDFRYEDFYAGIRTGEHLFHLKLIHETDPSVEFVSRGKHFHLYIITDDLENTASRFKENGVNFLEEIADTNWGTKEFSISDNQGHILCFGQG